MQRYHIKITGTQPLIMHADDVGWSDSMDAWKNNPDNKRGSKAGDDRSPAWRWLGCLYHDSTNIVMPTNNLMRCLMEAGALVYVPGGKSGKTFKSQTQSGLIPTDHGWPLHINGDSKPLAAGPIMALKGVSDFEQHEQTATKLGFSLFVKRAKIGASKHIRVRPRFERWHTSGLLSCSDEQITLEILQQIFTQGGLFKGLGDWRPGGKTPGPFGTFTAEVKKA
jgi:hypothetical protein